MPKVNNTEIYKYDEMPQLTDFLLGTDVGNNRKTRSYKLKAIIDLVNGTNGVNGIQYQFSDGLDVNIDYNSEGYFFKEPNEEIMSGFERFIFNKKMETGLNLSALFNFLGNTDDVVLKIVNPSDPNNFIHYKILGITEDTNYVTFDLENDVNLGLLANGFVYSIYWDINSAGAVTPTTPTLQQVTDEGDTTTNNITIPNGTLEGHAVNKGQLDLKSDQATTYTKDEVDDNFIPLSGTEVGKPVTGDIELNPDESAQIQLKSNNKKIIFDNNNDELAFQNAQSSVVIRPEIITIIASNSDLTILRGMELITETDSIRIFGNGGDFKGLVGQSLFDKQNEPNAFAQIGDIPIVQENPTENSTDAVSSGGVFDALGLKENTVNKNQNNGYCGLDSGGKVPIANLPSTLLKYQGVWNASTNTPTLTNPDLTKVGNVYNVSVAGTQFGITWNLGDWLIYNASGVPEKSDNSDDVVSVNGQTGVVTLTTANVNDSTGRRYVTESEKATWNAKENAITSGTTSQYFRGDKTFQTLDKTAVGLANVDNTSDANKPVSTAQATALNARQLKARTIYQGYTTVTGVTVPTIAFSVQIPANTYEAIDAFEVIVTVNKSSTVTAVNYNLFHDTVLNGTTNAIANGISLANIIRASAFQRQLNLSGGSAFNTLPSGTSVLNAFNSSGSIPTTTSFNPAVNNFITLQISGHTVLSESSSVTLSIRPLKG